ncbi:MAG: amidohydrolase family protein [Myxococcales bacterium]|nr:amidohydrolase family protein [Thermoleophilia bacterium]MDH4281026.1 amidohydrolase family protein [Myxococcales bacterium]MDH5281522.1 amidohydrolase family protein [Thermoleophilia bacterium]
MIDFHVHQPRAEAYGSDEYIQVMDQLGVELSVVFTFEGLLRPSPEANDSLSRFVGPFPDRLVAFSTVDPRDALAAAEIERCSREYGMRGVKLHPWLQGFPAHEPGLDAVCAAVAELGIPLLFHDGTPPFSTPLQLASLARRHPQAIIVLGHGGLHDLWREAIAAVSQNSNVYLCMCATPPYAMRAIVDRCPLDRLLFGTDAGLRPHPFQRYAALRVRQLHGLGLTAAQSRAILHDNPRRLLGLAGS